MTESSAGPSAPRRTTCPDCGTELASATVDFAQTPDVTTSVDEDRAEFRAGEMAAVDYCPSSDCPGKIRESGPDLDPAPGAQL